MTFFEICLPERVVFDNWDKALKFINQHIKLSNLYITVYNYTELNKNGKINYNSAVIKKLFFDFDKKRKDFLEECKKMCRFLCVESIKHENILSGNGFHILVGTKVDNIINKKACILNAQKYFIDKLNLNVDPQVLGNVAQERRLPNSYHFGAKRFCVPITCDELQSYSLEQLYKLGEKQRFGVNNISGNKLFELSVFDRVLDYSREIEEISERIDISIGNDSLLLVNGTNKKIPMPPFILNILNESKNNPDYWVIYHSRYIIIMWCLANGLNYMEIEELMREYLKEDEFKHFMSEGGHKSQAKYLWERANSSTNPMFFPNVSTLISRDYKLNFLDIKMIEELRDREHEI